MATEPVSYEPVKPHWFYSEAIHGKAKHIKSSLNFNNWQPFNIADSNKIEQLWQSCHQQLSNHQNFNDEKQDTAKHHEKKTNLKCKKNKSHDKQFVVQTDNGLYDVDLKTMHRLPVYWREELFHVRRGTWFYKKEGHLKYEPYDELTSKKLESWYEDCCLSNTWSKSYNLTQTDLFVINGPDLFSHYDECRKEEWVSLAENPYSSRQVHRGVDGIFNLEHGEIYNNESQEQQFDHLIFFVHGVGGVCDVRFRSCIEVVYDFGNIANKLLAEHIKENNMSFNDQEAPSPTSRQFSQSTPTSSTVSSNDSFNRTDSETKQNQQSKLFKNKKTIKEATRKSISQSNKRVAFLPICWHHKTRTETGVNEFLNHIALTKVPKFRQFVNKLVVDALLYSSGPVYSQAIIDIVGEQLNNLYTLFMERHPSFQGTISIAGHSLGSVIMFDLLANQETQSKSNSDFKTGNFDLTYPQLKFKPSCFFAFGSPLGMFLTSRGSIRISPTYTLPTCEKMFNIFHPYDPLAYRIEPLIDPNYRFVEPIIVPHHKGGKRMHLIMREGIAKISSDLKHRLFGSLKKTWSSFTRIGSFSENDKETIQQSTSCSTSLNRKMLSVRSSSSESSASGSTPRVSLEDTDGPENDSLVDLVKYPIGKLNQDKRIDYVLQENPIEYVLNEYLFAFSSHASYWQNEDCAMMMLNEIYKADNINLFDA